MEISFTVETHKLIPFTSQRQMQFFSMENKVRTYTVFVMARGFKSSKLALKDLFFPPGSLWTWCHNSTQSLCLFTSASHSQDDCPAPVSLLFRPPSCAALQWALKWKWSCVLCFVCVVREEDNINANANSSYWLNQQEGACRPVFLHTLPSLAC